MRLAQLKGYEERHDPVTRRCWPPVGWFRNLSGEMDDGKGGKGVWEFVHQKKLLGYKCLTYLPTFG